MLGTWRISSAGMLTMSDACTSLVGSITGHIFSVFCCWTIDQSPFVKVSAFSSPVVCLHHWATPLLQFFHCHSEASSGLTVLFYRFLVSTGGSVFLVSRFLWQRPCDPTGTFTVSTISRKFSDQAQRARLPPTRSPSACLQLISFWSGVPTSRSCLFMIVSVFTNLQ